MAMVKCPECGHDISSTASKCPKCGYAKKDVEGMQCFCGCIVAGASLYLFIRLMEAIS